MIPTWCCSAAPDGSNRSTSTPGSRTAVSPHCGERAQIGPDAVIDLVDAAGLLGRGGAAFPTATKWRAVGSQSGTPRHLVCNADESEPGTFKDRVLIENDPFALLESMAIAALAADCAHGWIYLRGEYPDVEATLTSAIDTFRREAIIGDGFDITLRRGAGAYICGEETAIFNSIEGFRGEPRNKPPYPFEQGLFGLPTVVNNVETLMNVPSIVLGQATSNRRLFCLSGAIARPGVYEVELGLTLGELLELAGGLPAGSELQAVLLGGAAGRYVVAPLARPGPRSRVDPSGRSLARLRRGDGARPARRPRRPDPPHRRVLPRRIVRPVRAVPRGNRLAGGSPRAAGERRA